MTQFRAGMPARNVSTDNTTRGYDMFRKRGDRRSFVEKRHSPGATRARIAITGEAIAAEQRQE